MINESNTTLNETTSQQPKLNEDNTPSKDNASKMQGKKPLTPYQKYKFNKNKNGKKYFEFYDDIKVYTHNIYDW